MPLGRLVLELELFPNAGGRPFGLVGVPGPDDLLKNPPPPLLPLFPLLAGIGM